MSDVGPAFRYLNKQGVESDTGFVVQFTGRCSLEYRRQSFCMECGTEDAYFGGLPGVNVQLPFPFGNLTAARHAEIIVEIESALDFMGLRHEVT